MCIYGENSTNPDPDPTCKVISDQHPGQTKVSNLGGSGSATLLSGIQKTSQNKLTSKKFNWTFFFLGKPKNILVLSTMEFIRGRTDDDQREKPALFKFYDFSMGNYEIKAGVYIFLGKPCVSPLLLEIDIFSLYNDMIFSDPCSWQNSVNFFFEGCQPAKNVFLLLEFVQKYQS